MPHRWKQTIHIDLKLARELIETQMRLSVAKIVLLDEGWDNVVYQINDAIIVRFPRREPGLVCMENEIALLPYVAQHVTFPLSAPKWIGQASDFYPYPFAGYPLLPGKSLCDATVSLIDNKTFAETIALWLKELHSMNVRNFDLQLLKGDHDWRLNVAHRVTRCKENLAQYERYFLQAGLTKEQLLAVIEIISNFKFNEIKKSYVHGDLYHRHILVDPKHMQPTGLIDWGDIHISHPGIDLGVGMIFTHPIFEYFLSSYGDIDDNTRKILLLHSFAHAMSFLPYAYEQQKESLKHWGYLQLKRSIDEILLKFT